MAVMGIWCCTGLMLGGGRPFESKTKKNERPQDHVHFNTWQITQEANINTPVRSVRLKKMSYAVFFFNYYFQRYFQIDPCFWLRLWQPCAAAINHYLFLPSRHTRRLTFISEAKATPGNKSCSLEAVLCVVIPSLNTNTCTETEWITC